MTKTKVWLGIDPGKSGSVAWVSEDNEVCYFHIPLVGTEVSVVEMKNAFKTIVEEFDIQMCVLENVHSMFQVGAKSNFQFGRVLGMLEALIAAFDIPVVLIPPKKWQKLCHQGVPFMKDNIKGMSLLAAQRLFPQYKFTTNESVFFATKRARTPHDGVIDAVLMAFYSKQTYNISNA